MTTTADRVVLDTNVLLAAVDESRTGHREAQHLLSTDQRALAVTPQVVREFLSVATRPMTDNGFGLSGPDAADTLDELLLDVDVLGEPASTHRRLSNLVRNGTVAGKQVHDAHLALVAAQHRAAALVTANVRHFARFADLVTIEALVP